MSEQRQRQDWEIILYGSDAASESQRRADVGQAIARESAAYNETVGNRPVIGHGMSPDGGQRFGDPRPTPRREPFTGMPVIHPGMTRTPSADEKPSAGIDKESMLLAALLNRGKKQNPLPPKIEIKNPAVPQQKKDYTVLVALIGLVAAFASKLK